MTGGRRIVLDEFPLRDDPNAEDLGRKAKLFSIEAYVLGPDYMKARDVLIEALDAYGPGGLVHPYFGSRTVAVQEWRVRETTDKGGMATFSISFCEAGKNPQPDETVDTSWAVKDSAATVQETSKKDFAASFDVKGSEWVRTEAIDLVNTALDEVWSVFDQAAVPVNFAGMVASDMTSLRSDVSTLIATPDVLANRITGIVSGLFPQNWIGSSSSDGLSVQRVKTPVSATSDLFIYSGSVPAASPLSTMGAKASQNAEAVSGLIRRTSMTEAAVAASTMTFDTFDDAQTVRDVLVNSLEDEAASATDPVYLALTELRVAVVKDFADRAGLPRLTSYTPSATLPGLALAHAIYGDASRADEICRRNWVRHPGAIPGGVKLEVLTND
ncbi:DNA circularization N-terminal domain-containing protein [Pseudodesulfovibrio sp. JC047]|uniref:DNA circularization protein n=1 Tax=Pseudodesulfovibrio sp. JC047 TaxID=2683199 RepID=UPI001EF329A4|nr:DNA circularization N-terminal domain-containing protein [Pseudodesulfovibrio sp. JC047]